MATITASPFRLALIQLGTTSTIKADNIALARAKVAEAAAAVPKPDLIVLPEIWNSPYAVTSFRQYSEPVPAVGSTGGGTGGINGHGNGDVNGNGDAEHQGRGEVEGETITALRQMARDAGCWLIGGSIPEREASTDSIFNCATAYDPQGKMVAKHRKVHLFDIDIPGRQKFKESDVLTGGNQVTSFDAPFGKIGMGICYDIRFPELAMIAARQGCVAMIYPSAFNTTTGPMHWTLLQKARAVDNQMYVAMCSPARNPNASYQAWGHSMVVNPLGEVLVEADHEPAILYADIDPEMLATVRRNLPVTIQRRFDVYPDVAAGAKQ